MKAILISFALVMNLLSHGQNIGIGITSPVGKLQVNHRSTLLSPNILLVDSTSSRGGNIRFRNVNSAAYMELYGFSNNLLHSADQYLDIQSDSIFIATFRGNGNVGIGNAFPNHKLDVQGNIRSSTMAGTGNRPVFVDPNGQLYAFNDLNTGVTNISPQSFSETNSHTDFPLIKLDYGVYFTHGSNYEIGAHVNVPHGSRIITVKVVLYDNSTWDLKIKLLSTPTGQMSGTILAEFTTVGTSTSERTLIANLNHLVDNYDNFYTVTVAPLPLHGWDSNALRIRGIAIVYTY